MRERPILFKGAMVRVLLAGTKTQTRRAVKIVAPPSAGGAGVISSPCPDSDGLWFWLEAPEFEGGVPVGDEFRCPYGVPGDRLWVKETWAAQQAFDHLSPTEIGQAFAEEHGEPWCPIRYVADGKCEGSVEQWQESPLGKTRVSIHMPRWASRITLELTEVRVERLQDISEADALAEGIIGDSVIVGTNCNGGVHREETAYRYWPSADVDDDHEGHDNAVDAYRELWEQINAAGSWDANPWVWALSFRRVEAA